MKQLYLKCLFLGILSFLGIKAEAYDCKVDGIYYNLDETDLTASVTAEQYSGNNYAGTVSIPSTITYDGIIYSVTTIGNRAFYGCTGLTSITIPSSVTNIGQSAFIFCESLTSVTIPNSVTTIGKSAFRDCTGLTSVTIPNSVTTIGQDAFSGCSRLTSVEIPNSVTNIGISAFQGCSGLISVTIGNGVTTIGQNAFQNCSGLTSVTIGNSVTRIVQGAFDGCKGLTKVIVKDIAAWCNISFGNVYANPLYYAHHLYSDVNTETTTLNIPSSVTSIGNNAFSGCRGLTSIDIPSSVTSIGGGAFRGCSGLTSIEIPNSVTSIGGGAFRGCTGLTSVTIPNSVTTIGQDAFSGCSRLTSIDIPSSVTSIGGGAFDGTAWYNNQPNGLVYAGKVAYKYKGTMSSNTKITLIEGTKSITGGAFRGCTGLTSVTIPNSVTYIGDYAFYECTGLTSIDIPSSVTSIGNYVFYECTGLTSIDIPSSVTSIGEFAFWGCSGLTSIEIPSSVTNVGTGAFYETAWYNNQPNGLVYAGKVAYKYKGTMPDNTEITLIEGTKSIGNYAFKNCCGLTSITIPNSVTSIGESAFLNCSSLFSVTIGDNVTSIGYSAFDGCSHLDNFIVNKGTKSLLTIWNNDLMRTYETYEKNTGDYLPRSSISFVSATQTSITVTIADYYEGYTYTINGEIVKKGENKTYSGMQPGEYKSLTLRLTLDDVSYCTGGNFYSNGIDLKFNTSTTSSSISVVGSYTHGDAVVTKEEIYVDGKKVSDGNKYYISGLDPNTEHTIRYSTNFESITEKVSTVSLTLITSQPRVISAGNAIVAAESNLDDEETNVGFEWRRIDWTDDFASNKGNAYLYNGTMEGYIRNLYTEKLWKYRPYYTSNAGNTYYGEWVGIDPTNTSYFEPTVHTYANITVNGNSAEVKGYVQRGTDNVVSKGFAYWEQPQGVKSREAMSAPSMISSLPSNAKTVEVSGSQQVMTASLSNLEYETAYCYVAFVRTSEGDTFYGEEMTFTSGESPYTLGDVNGDKKIDISDVVAMVNHILGNTPSTSFKPQAADINKDGNIDISDVVALVNMILN